MLRLYFYFSPIFTHTLHMYYFFWGGHRISVVVNCSLLAFFCSLFTGDDGADVGKFV